MINTVSFWAVALMAVGFILIAGYWRERALLAERWLWLAERRLRPPKITSVTTPAEYLRAGEKFMEQKSLNDLNQCESKQS